MPKWEEQRIYLACALGSFFGFVLNFILSRVQMPEMLRLPLSVVMAFLIGFDRYESFQKYPSWREYYDSFFPLFKKRLAILSTTSDVPEEILQAIIFKGIKPTSIACAFDWPQIKSMCEKENVEYAVLLGDRLFNCTDELVFFTSKTLGVFPNDVLKKAKALGASQINVIFI